MTERKSRQRQATANEAVLEEVVAQSSQSSLSPVPPGRHGGSGASSSGEGPRKRAGQADGEPAEEAEDTKRKKKAGTRTEEAQKYAAMATLAPLLTQLFSFVAYNSVETDRVAILFYSVTTAGILITVYALQLEYASRRIWGFDSEQGLFAASIRSKLKSVELNEEPAKKRFPFLAHITRIDVDWLEETGYENEKEKFQYEARRYCQAARRAAKTAKSYFYSLTDHQVVAPKFRHVAGSEAEAACRIIHLVDEMIGRDSEWFGHWNLYNFFRMAKDRRRTSSACLRQDLNFDARKAYWKILEIVDMFDEMEQTFLEGENWNNALARFTKLEETTKSSLKTKALFALVIAQLALNVATLLANSTQTGGRD